MPPARCWSSAAVGQPGAHRPLAQRGVPVLADAASSAPMIVTPEEGVEGQRHHDHQHPERVGHPARAPGRRPSAARRTASRPARGGRASSRGRTSSCRRGVVPAGEVERPRARRRRAAKVSGGKVSTFADPRVQHDQQPAPRARRQGPQRQRDRRTQRQRQRHQHRQDHVLDHVHAQQRRVVGAPARTAVAKANDAHPDDHERQGAAHGPAVPAPVQRRTPTR